MGILTVGALLKKNILLATLAIVAGVGFTSCTQYPIILTSDPGQSPTVANTDPTLLPIHLAFAYRSGDHVLIGVLPEPVGLNEVAHAQSTTKLTLVKAGRQFLLAWIDSDRHLHWRFLSGGDLSVLNEGEWSGSTDIGGDIVDFTAAYHPVTDKLLVVVSQNRDDEEPVPCFVAATIDCSTNTLDEVVWARSGGDWKDSKPSLAVGRTGFLLAWVESNTVVPDADEGRAGRVRVIRFDANGVADTTYGGALIAGRDEFIGSAMGSDQAVCLLISA